MEVACRWVKKSTSPTTYGATFAALPHAELSTAFMDVAVTAAPELCPVELVDPELTTHSAPEKPTKRSSCPISHWIGPRDGALRSNANESVARVWSPKAKFSRSSVTVAHIL